MSLNVFRCDSLRSLELFGGISSLEYLKLSGSIHEIFVQESLSSLVEADSRITLGDDSSNRSIAESLHAFDYAKVVTLSSFRDNAKFGCFKTYASFQESLGLCEVKFFSDRLGSVPVVMRSDSHGVFGFKLKYSGQCDWKNH